MSKVTSAASSAREILQGAATVTVTGLGNAASAGASAVIETASSKAGEVLYQVPIASVIEVVSASAPSGVSSLTETVLIFIIRSGEINQRFQMRFKYRLKWL